MPPTISLWSRLPTDLLQLIADHLTDIADHARLRCVCASWRSAKISTALPLQLPWLLFPSNPYARHHEPRHFFSLLNNRVSPLFLPHKSDPRSVGSADGWLLLTRPASLLNPLTGTLIPLPFIADPIKSSKLCRSGASDHVLMVSFKGNRSPSLAYHRTGDAQWGRIDLDEGPTDFAYYKGIFFVFRRDGTAQAINWASRRPEFVIPATAAAYGGACRRYLVESPSSKKLLLVVRPLVVQREKFEIFKLDRGSDQKQQQPPRPPKWEKIESIGNDLLFVDDKHALCFDARRFSGFRKNCIYFTDIYRVCLYSIKDKRVEQLPIYWENFPYPKELKEASWFVPSLNQLAW